MQESPVIQWSAIDPNPDLTPEQNQQLLERIDQLVHLGVENHVQPGDAVGLSQDYFDGLYELALRHYQQHNYESASLVLTRLLQLKPYELSYYKSLGACYLGLKRFDAAITAYQCGEIFGAMDAELHYYMGLAFYFKKEFEPAFDLFRFARVLDEQDPKSDHKIADFATQLLTRIQPLVGPEQAKKMDLRPQ